MNLAVCVVITFAALALCASSGMTATVPQLMNYQGRLNDNTGAPVDGTKTIVFSLYSSATGTPAIWTETQNVNVNNGAFNAVLGSVTPLPTTVFDNAEVWLGIAVGSDLEMTPRQRISSVGYSVRAAKADSVASSDQIVSTMPTGTAPFTVSSTTMVTNLNADMVGGKHASDLVLKAGDTMTGNLTVPNLFLTNSNSSINIGTARIYSFGNNNFFAGHNAGNFFTSGGFNLGIGGYNLYSNTTGYENTASGSYALQWNTGVLLTPPAGHLRSSTTPRATKTRRSVTAPDLIRPETTTFLLEPM